MTERYSPYPDKWCKAAEDVPDRPHFVILRSGTIHVPSEPGYPGGPEPVLEYRIYTSEERWRQEIEALVKAGKKDWKAVRVVPAKVVTKVMVEVDVTGD